MKKDIGFRYFVIFFLLLNIISIQSQSNPKLKDYYKWLDSIIGYGNIGIYNGTEHKVKYVTQKGNHQFYFTSEYLVGDIIYDDQPYYDIHMKYDIYNDELIVKLPFQSGFSAVQLIKEKIKVFFIKNSQFIKINRRNKESLSEEDLGFYEVLIQNDHIIFYKKHKKYRSEHLDKEFAYNEFNYKSEYLLRFNNNYHDIKSKRTLTQLFPENRKQINSFFNKNKILLKSDYDLFLINLMKLISRNFSDIKTASK